MKHLKSISRTPSPAISLVEFDGILAVFGRTLTALTNTFNFALTVLGLPDEFEAVKGGESAR